MSVSKPLITPCLWFDSEGEEAARFYTSIFPNSEILHISHYTEVSSLIWLSLAMTLLAPPAGSCLGDLACLAASEEAPDDDSGFDADETSKMSGCATHENDNG
jgi:hypothetical protein